MVLQVLAQLKQSGMNPLWYHQSNISAHYASQIAQNFRTTDKLVMPAQKN
jgi:hypothetical protein